MCFFILLDETLPTNWKPNDDRKSIYIAQNRYEKKVLVAVLHSIIHNDWTYVFATLKKTLEEESKPPPGLCPLVVGRGHLLMRGSKSNFESVMVTVVWGKLLVQQEGQRNRGFTNQLKKNNRERSASARDSRGELCVTERSFSLVNGSLAVVEDGSGRIDVITPTHRLHFLVEVNSELSHDKWLKVLAHSIAIFDREERCLIDFAQHVRKQAMVAKMGGNAMGGSSYKQSLSPKRDFERMRNETTDSVPGIKGGSDGNIMLAKHFLLNFCLAFQPPSDYKASNVFAKEKNEMGQCKAILHLDSLRKSMDVNVKGTNALTIRFQNIDHYESDEEGAFPSLSIQYCDSSDTNANAFFRTEPRKHTSVFFFQALHELELCKLLLHNTIGKGPSQQLPLQRSILIQGKIQKKGKSGIFCQRYAVLIPNKLLLLRSKTAYIPLQIVTFGNERRKWDIQLDKDPAVVNMVPEAMASDSTLLEASVGKLMNGNTISLKFSGPEEAMDWYNHIHKQSRAACCHQFKPLHSTKVLNGSKKKSSSDLGKVATSQQRKDSSSSSSSDALAASTPEGMRVCGNPIISIAAPGVDGDVDVAVQEEIDEFVSPAEEDSASSLEEDNPAEVGERASNSGNAGILNEPPPPPEPEPEPLQTVISEIEDQDLAREPPEVTQSAAGGGVEEKEGSEEEKTSVSKAFEFWGVRKKTL